MFRLFCSLALVAGWAVSAVAHPVAYQNSIGVMSSLAPDRTEIQANYSFTPRLAAGTDYVRIAYREDDVHFGIARMNARVIRVNRPHSQGNVYLYTGMGAREYRGNTEDAFFYGGEADWETRKHYISGRAQALRSPKGMNFEQYTLRAGIAPYVAEFEALHTWLIAQGMYEPDAKNEFTWAPMVRMFYRNVLWETGVSTRGEFLFNTIIHF